MSHTIIFETQILSGLDDVEERSSGSMYINSTDLELADDGVNTGQTVGLRFTDINIPQGATITSAYIQFQTDEVKSGTATLLIRAEDVDDAAAFVKVKHNVSSRSQTDASTIWTPTAWSKVGEAGFAQRTPDLTAIVQEVIDRSGWAALNDMVFIITGSGTRTAESFEGSATGAPRLHIEYTMPHGGNIAPAIDLSEGALGTGYSAIFHENGAATQIAAADIIITDADSANLMGATVQLTNAKAGDQLVITGVLSAGITLDASSTATQIILTGPASPDAYEIALRQIAFRNTTETPDPANRLINVTVSDGLANSNTAVATISIDRAPDAVGDTATTTKNTAVTTGNVLANDDLGDTPTTITGFNSVSVKGGTVVSNGNGTFTYTPANNFIGTDSFIYTITDADGDSSSASVTVSVTSSGGNPNPTVVAVHNTTDWGVPDPSGLAYDPSTGKFFLSDSEIDETPFFLPTDMFLFTLDGTRTRDFALSFTKEATGLALDPDSNRLFISDDDRKTIYVVNPANPTTLLASFGTVALGATDPEDVAVDALNDRLFICSGSDRKIVETNYSGTQVFSTIILPTVIRDPEALAYDPGENVFYVGGKFSSNIWKLDRNGNILNTFDLLKYYPNPVNGYRVAVTDIELAPASDGSGELHLYVVDYGRDQVMDGRMFEIDLGDHLLS